MSPAKRFLLIFFGLSFVIWLGGTLLLGPPGMSSDYLSDGGNKQDHGLYLDISKNDAYKRYVQRPELNHPETLLAELEQHPPAELMPEDIAHQKRQLQAIIPYLDFVAEYQQRPAYLAEQRRRTIYGTFFDCFNAALFVILVLRFGSKPILNLIDTQIAELRERMDASAKARGEAEARQQKARGKIDGLPEEETQLAADTEARLEHELAELEEANAHSIQMMHEELEDRRKEELHHAWLAVKAELVNASVDRLAESYAQDRTAEGERARVENFIAGLEKQV